MNNRITNFLLAFIALELGWNIIPRPTVVSLGIGMIFVALGAVLMFTILFSRGKA